MNVQRCPRTHQGLSAFALGGISNNDPNVILETLVQHSIGLIQHKVCYTVENELD